MKLIVAALVPLLALDVTQAQNLVKNGDFETVINPQTGTAIAENGNYFVRTGQGNNQDLYGVDLAGWSNNSTFGIVYGAGIGDDPSFMHYEYNDLNYKGAYYLMGPRNGHANGMPDSSPTGGNYFGTDSNYYQGPLSQTVQGLVTGQSYTLSFYWAAAVISTGAGNGQTSGWNVSLAGAAGTDATTSVISPSYDRYDFVPWQQSVVNFVANSSTETLTFTPTGTGSPPMSLLDGVAIYAGTNVTAVPEPQTLALWLGGLGVLALLRRRRSAT